MWVNTIDPVLVHLGLLEIRWYGIIYVLGFFLSVWWLHYLSKKGKVPLKGEEIWDFIFYAMLGVLIGSRLFEVFWEPNYYLSNPFNFLKFWQGGMSFHGGFAGIVTASWIYCKAKKINFWQMADMMSFPTILALGLGRIANFANGELWGTVWSGKWCVVFPRYDDLCRHPSVLYSAGQRLILSGWLCWLTLKREFKRGFVFWNFVLWEGVGRFIIDFWREDVMVYGLTIGQWFSIIMIIIALRALLIGYRGELGKIFK
ncbi:prolipoprotein diacylglyceryl transferase [Candidatus Woesearchaeota archaeon]|nr:prolipoprotein diacylglyceryl transferase [Candidatus Woesearchaeota archaeon]